MGQIQNRRRKRNLLHHAGRSRGQRLYDRCDHDHHGQAISFEWQINDSHSTGMVISSSRTGDVFHPGILRRVGIEAKKAGKR